MLLAIISKAPPIPTKASAMPAKPAPFPAEPFQSPAPLLPILRMAIKPPRTRPRAAMAPTALYRPSAGTKARPAKEAARIAIAVAASFNAFALSCNAKPLRILEKLLIVLAMGLAASEITSPTPERTSPRPSKGATTESRMFRILFAKTTRPTLIAAAKISPKVIPLKISLTTSITLEKTSLTVS